VAFRRPPRLRGFSYVGEHRYFVTCSVAERRAAFVDQESVTSVRSQILLTCSERQFVELASIYMPDHVHLLLRGDAPSSTFLPFMKVLRQRTAMHYRRLRGETLWQDGYFDRVLRPDDDVTNILDYMRNNPVRAKLVERWEDYPFFYEREEVSGARNFSCASESFDDVN
jgi:REP-associated tyrosine transposase